MIEILCSFLGALMGRLFATELYAWAPTVADWLLCLYVRFLPQEVGERLLEEWRALLHNTPGNLSKLLRTIDLGRTMLFIRREATELEKFHKSIEVGSKSFSNRKESREFDQTHESSTSGESQMGDVPDWKDLEQQSENDGGSDDFLYEGPATD